MTPDELKEAGMKLYGERWKNLLAEQLKVDGSTVRRWSSGAVPVPGPVEAAIKCWLDSK